MFIIISIIKFPTFILYLHFFIIPIVVIGSIKT
ncbi:unnamed protein product [Schistosoma curassoni]|uniref:Uncharacterized protein n=1 Tax=Schistosoma curassoni TaxID=6186 RepID=A0A183JRH0_9TREM|nr:unnamed protein product [Schistosoma curassoni]